VNTEETSIEAFLRERLVATERLLAEAVEGQRSLREMLEAQAVQHQKALEGRAAQHREALELNRKLQAELERLNVMVESPFAEWIRSASPSTPPPRTRCRLSTGR